MRILVLSELLYPHGSGAELATSLWIKLLARSGFKVRVITSQFRGEPQKSSSEGIEIFRLPLIGSSCQKYSLLGRSHILFSHLFRKSLKWSNVVYVPRFWYAAIPFARACGKAVITHLHDYIPVCSLGTRYDLSRNTSCTSTSSQCRLSCLIGNERSQGSVIRTFGSALLNFAVWPQVGRWVRLSDAIVCVSKVHLENITSRMPSVSRKCRLIHNPLPDIQASSIRGNGLGYFGGSNAVKGFKTLMGAAARTKVPITVFATGFNYRNQVSFPNGSRLISYTKLSAPEFEQLYRKLQTVVVPSIWDEPWPYVVSEAILRGRLLVASRVGGIAEQTAHCPGAFLTSPNDEPKLADLMEFATGIDREKAADLALKNREVYIKRYNNSRSVEEFASLLAKFNSKE